MKVEQVMNRPVVACGTGDSLGVAAALMWEHDCGLIPVVDDKRHVLGVLTDRDICMAAMLTGRPLATLPVGETMTRDVVTCRPDDTIEQAEQTMALRQLRRLPVVDAAGRAVGIVSLNDLAREESGERASGVASTLAAICQPRQTAIAAQPADPKRPTVRRRKKPAEPSAS